MLSYNELRKIAEDATPGPWTIDYSYQYWGDKIRAHSGQLIGGAYSSHGNWINDVRYMQEANPKTMIKMLDEIERLNTQIKKLESYILCSVEVFQK